MSEWEIPPGYGWVPKRAKPETPATDAPKSGSVASGRSWDMPVGYFGDEYAAGDLDLFTTMTAGEMAEQLAHFTDSGDTLHLWRAWKAARAFHHKHWPPEFMALLAPHFDKMADAEMQAQSELRTNQRETRRWALARYYHELRRRKQARPGCVVSDKEARERAAAAHGTTAGTLKQWILEHEGRGQRGRKR